MDFAVPLAILAFLGAVYAYDDTDEDFSDDIPKLDSDGYMDSIVPPEDSSQSVLENPLQVALARIFEMKRKQNNFPKIKYVKKVSSTTDPMKQTRTFTTTNVPYHVNTTVIANYGPTPGKFTKHDEAKSTRETDSYVDRSKSNKEEHKQETSSNAKGEILKLSRRDLNTSSLLLRFKWPHNRNGQSYKFYLQNIFVNNFSYQNSTMPNVTMDWRYNGPLTPVTFIVHKNMSALLKCNDSIVNGSATAKRIQERSEMQNIPKVLGLDVEIWRSEKIARKQEMAMKMLLQ